MEPRYTRAPTEPNSAGANTFPPKAGKKARDALLETLRITLEEALDANRADARSAASEEFEEVRIACEAARAGALAQRAARLVIARLRGKGM